MCRCDACVRVGVRVGGWVGEWLGVRERERRVCMRCVLCACVVDGKCIPRRLLEHVVDHVIESFLRNSGELLSGDCELRSRVLGQAADAIHQ